MPCAQAIDSLFLQYTIAGTIASSGQSVQLLFAFEYVILASTIIRYALKYTMSMVRLGAEWIGHCRCSGGWVASSPDLTLTQFCNWGMTRIVTLLHLLT